MIFFSFPMEVSCPKTIYIFTNHDGESFLPRYLYTPFRSSHEHPPYLKDYYRPTPPSTDNPGDRHVIHVNMFNHMKHHG